MFVEISVSWCDVCDACVCVCARACVWCVCVYVCVMCVCATRHVMSPTSLQLLTGCERGGPSYPPQRVCPVPHGPLAIDACSSLVTSRILCLQQILAAPSRYMNIRPRFFCNWWHTVSTCNTEWVMVHVQQGTIPLTLTPRPIDDRSGTSLLFERRQRQFRHLNMTRRGVIGR